MKASSLLVRPRSLWRHNPIPAGCVLYIPAFHNSIRGVGFKSTDPYGHLCIVTGATKDGDGFLFDGTDDRIDCGARASLNFIDKLTIMAWSKLTTTGASRYIASKRNSGSGTEGYGFLSNASEALRLELHGVNAVNSSLTIPDTTAFHFMSVSYDRSNANFTLDTDTDAVALVNAPNSSAAIKLLIGRLNEDSDGANWIGTIGELWAFERALAQGEVNYIYQRTRGRYQ